CPKCRTPEEQSQVCFYNKQTRMVSTFNCCPNFKNFILTVTSRVSRLHNKFHAMIAINLYYYFVSITKIFVSIYYSRAAKHGKLISARNARALKEKYSALCRSVPRNRFVLQSIDSSRRKAIAAQPVWNRMVSVPSSVILTIVHLTERC